MSSCCTGVISLFVFTFILTPPSRFILSNELPKCPDVNSTVESCCPCFQEMVDTCEVACPQDYLLITSSKDLVQCEKNSSSETDLGNTTTTATTVSMVTENVTESENATKAPEPVEVYNSVRYCVKSCGMGKWYNNASHRCDDCDKSCLRCDTKDMCTVCKYELNNKCLAKCPDGMVSSKTTSENGTRQCEEEEKKDNIVIIVVPVCVSVVVIGVVIVVICCVCRRRRSNRASLRGSTADTGSKAESGLLKEKQRSKPGYENMLQTKPTSTEIQNQTDNVLRYTKDPTVKVKNKENEGGFVEEEEYGNAPMINLAKKTDLTNKPSETVKEMLEVENMGPAPKPPIQLPTGKDKKKGKGIVKSLSQRVSKKLGRKKEKSSLPKPDEHIPTDYMDMSGDQSLSAVEANPDAVESGNRQSSGLQHYENVDFSKIPVGRQANVRNVQETNVDKGMEDYENPKLALGDKTKGDDSALEDYENASQFHVKKSKKPKEKDIGKQADDEEMEDYENTKDLRLDGSKKPKGTGKPGKSEDDEMEDYENMKDLELYENFQVGKK